MNTVGLVDTLSPEERSKRMARVRGRDTRPELLIRSLVHRMGYRFRLHRKSLPGKPDLVFPGRKKVIFVHGCFWHRHSDPNCPFTRTPKSKRGFWNAKFRENQARDQRNCADLEQMGWGVLVVWECQLKNLEQVSLGIRNFLDEARC